MRLAPAGDLHRLGQATDIADIDAVELMDAALDEGHELPLAGELLADGERNIGHGAQGLVGFRRLVADRLLEKIEHPPVEPAAEACRFGDRQPVVIIYAEHHFVAEFLARPVQQARRGGNGLARLEDIAAVLPDGKEADGVEPHLHELAGTLHRPFPGSISRGGEGGNDMALPAPEQFVNGHAERLALDVVKGDVDGRDGCLQHAAAFEVLAAVHLLPDATDLHGILPQQELAIVLDGTGDRAFPAGQPALAPAEDTLVGLHLDEQLVTYAYPRRIGLDGSDLETGGHRALGSASA